MAPSLKPTFFALLVALASSGSGFAADIGNFEGRNLFVTQIGTKETGHLPPRSRNGTPLAIKLISRNARFPPKLTNNSMRYQAVAQTDKLSSNVISVRQETQRNQFSGKILGSENIASVTQLGSGATATLLQSGSNNQLFAQQSSK